MKTNIINNIKAIVLGIIVVLGVQYVSAAWTAPIGTPPSNNVPAPINVGSIAQRKDATITATDLISENTLTTKDFTVRPGGTNPVSGQALIADGTTGKVKWGNLGGVSLPQSSGNCKWSSWFRREVTSTYLGSPQVAPVGSYIAGIDYAAKTGSGDDGIVRFYYCDASGATPGNTVNPGIPM